MTISHRSLIGSILLLERSRLCGVKPHVLRYWEQEFAELQPDKRRGNRRYYRYQDLIMIRRIRALVHQQGFTLSGAKLRIQEEDEARFAATQDDSKEWLCARSFEISSKSVGCCLIKTLYTLPHSGRGAAW